MEMNEELKQAQVAIERRVSSNPSLRRSYKDKTFPMKLSHHLPGTSKDETSKCHITAIAALTEGQLVVYDEANYRLQVMTQKGTKILEEEIYNCFDITATDKTNTFAITQTHRNVISFFSIERASIRTKSKTLSLPGIGFHCEYSRKNYCVVCDLTDPDSRSIVIMDHKGKARSLKIPSIDVSHITMHPKHDEVFITDRANKTISCFSFEKNVSISPFRRLQWIPLGLTVVASKYLFICDADTKTVIKLRSKLGGREEEEELWGVESAGLIGTNPHCDLLYVTNPPKDGEGVSNVTAFKIDMRKIHYEEFNYEL